MMNNTIIKEKNELSMQIEKIKNATQKKNELFDFKIPIEIMEEYIEFRENINIYHRKKRKQMDKKIIQWKQNYNSFDEDNSNFKEIHNMNKELKKTVNILKSTDSYIENEISSMLDILSKEKFIKKEDVYWSLTIKGMIASNLQEIHPLAFSELLLGGVFNELSTIDIISVISCLTSVSVPKKDCILNIEYVNCNNNIKDALNKIKKKFNKFYDIELDNRMNNIDNYELHWNMCELLVKWCNSNTEEECKAVYNEAGYYGICLGEFVKAILKINAIGLELEKVCLIKEDLVLYEKCKNIPNMTLKSIATNQSLYL